MKIIIIVSSLRGGGAERTAALLASAWTARGHQVTLLTLSPVSATDYAVPPTVKRDILTARAAKAAPLRILSRLKALRRYLTTNAPDTIVAIQANMAIETSLATWRTALRVIGCERNSPARAVRGRLWQAMRPLAYRRLARVVTQTQGAAEELRAICGQTPVSVIPNMLDLPLLATGAHIAPSGVVPETAHVLLAVGRLVHAKGFDTLIARFAMIAAQCPSLHLVILGEGPDRQTLTAQIADLGLGPRVQLPGRAGNLAQWYDRACLFTMTSRWEGMPMVLLEAMAHALPAIVTDCAHGPRDIISTTDEGIILPPDDAAAWCAAVCALYADPARRALMGQAAVAVRARFHQDAILQLWDKVLTEP